jgi:hypothetical protein
VRILRILVVMFAACAGGAGRGAEHGVDFSDRGRWRDGRADSDIVVRAHG